MIISETLDVTVLEPRLKHPTIFRHFDSLQAGEGFTIHNDHDPKPLYYQLLGERGNVFSWEYLKEGPEVWLVKITRNKKDEEGNYETVGSIAAKDYRKAEVFKKFGIDFCCGGEKSLKSASEEAGIPEDQLKEALEKANAFTTSASYDYNKWNLDFLADYIINTHHRYVKDTAQVINGLAQKVTQHHGEQNPELYELERRVNSFLTDLLDHVAKEEATIFPAIKTLVQNKGGDKNSSEKSLSMMIKRMHAEHDHAGNDLKYFRKITNNYALPPTACNSYRYLFEKLKEFEDDLFRHIHLENNILFPKSISLEQA